MLLFHPNMQSALNNPPRSPFKVKRDSAPIGDLLMEQTYSLSKVLLQGRAVDGWEREISQELTRTLEQPPLGVWVPVSILAGRRDLSAGIPGAGGVIIETAVERSLIAVLRKRSAVIALGGSVLENLVGNVSFPRQITPATPTWVTENQGLPPTDSSFDRIVLSPKRIVSQTNFSSQLLKQSSLQIDEMVRNDLSKGIGTALDLAALAGTGVNQPTGILNFPANAAGAAAYGSTALPVTFGATASWANVVQFESNVESLDQISDGTGGYLVSPKTKAKWKIVPKAVNYPIYLWMAEFNNVNGYNAIATNQLAATDRVIFSSRWSDCLIGLWPAIDVVSDPFSMAEYNIVKVITNLLADVQFRYALSFCPSTDSGAQ